MIFNFDFYWLKNRRQQYYELSDNQICDTLFSKYP
jgi:hypothetical protein